ncbi:alpha/beta fold hydrolase [Arhodomonas sp. SL1]|uniref:alpha/beta fold hydrolase n=1 Tax=Arhodomonas sp. SL1 TaxID=3425691 RepID=UPI003F8838A1
MSTADVSESIDPRWWPARSYPLSLDGHTHTVHEWPAVEEAATVVLLHGWMDTGAGFGPLAAALGEEWRCVAPDWRGFGDSARNPQGRYWFPDYLADLDRLLDGLLPDGEPVILVGHSMGGNVAGLYAGVRPERVRALVSLEGFGLSRTDPASAPVRYRQWLEALTQTPRLRSFPDFGALAGHLRQRNPEMPAAVAAFLAHCWGRESAGQIVLRGDGAHRRPNPVLYRLDEAMACWREITAPVLWLWGRESGMARRQRDSDDWHERLACFQRLETGEVAGAGHALHQEQPEETARQIGDFLRCLPGHAMLRG